MTIFDICPSFGLSLTINFENKILVSGEGKEQRIIPWHNPRIEIDLSRDFLVQPELDYISTFFQNRQGRRHEFKFKDPTDHLLNYRESGLETVALGELCPPADGTRTQFQLCKTYIIQGNPDYYYYRPIFAPIEGTIALRTSEGTPINSSNYSVDYDTGLITFSSPPTPGHLYCNGEFYIWCRFLEDKLQYRFTSYDETTGEKLYQISGLKLIEDKKTPPFPLSPGSFEVNLNHEFKLDLYYSTIGGAGFTTLISTAGSGLEARQAKQANSIGAWTLGNRILNQKEIDYLISLFRVTHGAGSNFNYTDVTGYKGTFPLRFDDSLSFRQDYQGVGENGLDSVYSFSGINAYEVDNLDQKSETQGGTLTYGKTYIFTNSVYWGFTAANGAEATDIVINNPININTFDNLEGAVYNGSASSGGGNTVTIVPNTPNTFGSAWNPDKLSLGILTNLNYSFSYRTQPTGGEGFAFVIQSSGTSALGDTSFSGSLGYGGLQSSIAVEFDFCQNPEFGDPNGNHIGININGQLQSVAIADPEINLRSTSDIYVWIEYGFGDPTLKVSISSNNSKPSTPVLSHPIDVATYFGVVEKVGANVNYGAFEDRGLKENSLAFCWKITREDGLVLGFTEHDRLLEIEGITYQPIGSPSPTSFAATSELSVDNSGMDGLIFPGLVEQEDLIAGKFDNAAVEVFIADWWGSSKIRTLQLGNIGQITFNNRIYQAEVRGIAQKLQQARVKRTVSLCPLRFGEQGPNKCNKDLSGLTDSGSVTDVDTSSMFSVPTGRPSKFFNEGTLTFTSGKNEGVTLDIQTHQGSRIILWEPAPFKPEVGDNCILVAGCEKTLKACKEYNNIENFGGDPFVPGTDFYLRGGEKLQFD